MHGSPEKPSGKGRRAVRRAVGAGVCAGLTVALMAAGSSRAAPPPYPSSPPPAHTGGFGEPTCRACHFDLPLNVPPGSVRVEGAPDDFSGAAGRIPLAVILTDPEMARAGFQLSARYADGPKRGSQAGSLLASDDRSEVRVGGGVQYAQQTEAGTHLTSTDTARWDLVWSPPEQLSGSVVLHLSANAANDDASEFGDRIFQDSVRIPVD